MAKSVEQAQFQRMKDELELEVRDLQRNVVQTPKQRTQKLAAIDGKMKTMSKLLIAISSDFRMAAPHDAFTTRKKIDKYTQDKNKLAERVDVIRDEVQKRELFAGAAKGETEATKLMLDMTERFQYVNKDLNETHQVVVGANNQLKMQGQVIEQIEGEAEQAEGELTMVEQLSKIINNRQLITRLILLFLVVVFGIADLSILLLRVI